MPSACHDAALAFVADFATLDVPTMLSRRTDDCIHTFLPLSIAPPSKDNAAFGKHIVRLREVMPKFPVTAQEVFEDEAKQVLIIHATSQAHFHEELKDDGITAEEWMYQGTYIFMLHFRGDKIKKVVEFLDSKGTERLLGLVQRARANREEAKTRKT